VVNYELGIIFPLYDAKDVERVSCFKRPARKYASEQDRPWVSSTVVCRGVTFDMFVSKIQEESQILRQSQLT
jgi:tyrosyl-DNA phosphodiesterase-1